MKVARDCEIFYADKQEIDGIIGAFFDDSCHLKEHFSQESLRGCVFFFYESDISVGIVKISTPICKKLSEFSSMIAVSQK